MVSLKSLVALFVGVAPALAAFGFTTSDSSYVIDSGSSNSFIVTVSRKDCSITSLKYRGIEYQYKSQTSHIASGLGSGTSVSIATVSSLYAPKFMSR